ncbi:hypothetical protein VPA32_orf236 [Klebsiella phage vB_KpnM_VPA32]|nr:hypothetical protein [Enterobacter phage vB-EclM_KMB19]UVD32615.1 hypothetical protein ENTB43_195 [Enterobacter phage Entb_43]WJJ59201.1 hypothetical protein VPA32_orf236 [Klebsiella phage vB_KpnM_VPA32]
MGIHTEVRPGLSSFRKVAEVVVAQVADNYLFVPATAPTYAQIHADIVGALQILWKNLEFKVTPSFNSYSMTFDFRLDIDKDDPIFFSVIYSWDNSDF